MNDEVELDPPGICNVYSHLTRMAGPILSHEDLTVFHEILAIMYSPPSELDLLHNQFTGREDEPMCHQPH